MSSRRGKKILIQTCCVACASHVFKELLKAGFNPVAFFYHPEMEKEEFGKRLKDLEEYCQKHDYEMIAEEQLPSEFWDKVEPFKDHFSIKYISDKDRYIRKRCHICNSTSIQKTIETAKKLRIRYFSTTLLCSPYKNNEEILSICNEKALDYNLNFYFSDFRKGFWTGRNYARNHNTYISSFCGCNESLKERRLE